MEETTCRPKGLFQNAAVFPLLEDPVSVLFFSFFRRKKGAYVFDSLVEREKGRERESLSFFFNNTSMPPLWSSKAKGSS